VIDSKDHWWQLPNKPMHATCKTHALDGRRYKSIRVCVCSYRVPCFTDDAAGMKTISASASVITQRVPIPFAEDMEFHIAAIPEPFQRCIAIRQHQQQAAAISALRSTSHSSSARASIEFTGIIKQHRLITSHSNRSRVKRAPV
jgi:hypothetical protein